MCKAKPDNKFLQEMLAKDCTCTVEGTDQLTKAHHLFKLWLVPNYMQRGLYTYCAIMNLLYSYIVIIIIAYAFHHHLSCYHLSYTLLQHTVIVLLQLFAKAGVCRVNTVPECEKPLVSVHQTIQIVLSGHALKPIFSTLPGLPISNHNNITTMYAMKAALCANICLWTLVIMSVAWKHNTTS